jgi:hypothetical protein
MAVAGSEFCRGHGYAADASSDGTPFDIVLQGVITTIARRALEKPAANDAF